MPNWCDNETFISGPIEEFEEFMDAFGGDTETYRFANIVRLPVENEDASLINQIAIRYWGTKWDLGDDILVGDIEVEDGDTKTVVLNYLTAWSPPIEFWQAVAKEFPKLYIDTAYFEPGIGYFGKLVIANGEVLQDTELSVSEVDTLDWTTAGTREVFDYLDELDRLDRMSKGN